MAEPFFLHNTASRKVEPFFPRNPEKILLYTCGPTVYGLQHIGNYRTFIFEDILVKALRQAGYGVQRVMNVTDVGHLTSDEDEGEDKMEVGARRDGTTAWEVAKKYEQAFLEDLQLLNIEKPDQLIRATETIEEQIALIQQLVDKGYTYTTSDGVYFNSSRFPRYGQMAHLDIAGLKEGARVTPNKEKRNLTDFALWKFSPPNSKRDMEWDSPWGKGFPGWHIECSAIALHFLGEELDIHCGGVDHIPVHHTNEIAQSEAVTGKPFAHYWLHADFLLVDGNKMAKSLGNLYTLADIVSRGIDPLAFRLYVYSASYRSKINFTWEGLEGAATSLHRLRTAARELKPGNWEEGSNQLQSFRRHFQAALADDLNTPQALAVVWEALKSNLSSEEKGAFLEGVDQVFSLNIFQDEEADQLELPSAVIGWMAEREKARENKDWQQADALRSQIEKAGFDLIDTVQGTSVRPNK